MGIIGLFSFCPRNAFFKVSQCSFRSCYPNEALILDEKQKRHTFEKTDLVEFWFVLMLKIPLGVVSGGTFWALGHRLVFGAPAGLRDTCWASGHLLGFGAPSGLRGTCWDSGHLLGFGASAGLRGTFRGSNKTKLVLPGSYQNPNLAVSPNRTTVSIVEESSKLIQANQ